VDSGVDLDHGPAPSVDSPEPTLRRLTFPQYRQTVLDVLGSDLALPTRIEPDSRIDGLPSIGATIMNVSAWGIERYEDAAYLLAEQALEDDHLLPCEPASSTDADCADGFVGELGLVLYRRPLTTEERSRLTDLVVLVGGATGDFRTGAIYGLAALLQSPYFLYRVELGTADPDDASIRWLDDYELATRLSYLLWNTTPDSTLLQAAQDGQLSTQDGLLEQANRLLDDPRAEQGVRNVFTEILHLDELDDLSKDPTVFTHASSDLGPLAREETLLGILDRVLVQDGDYRDLFTTQTTWVDRTLAALYNVEAPQMDGFGPITLARDDGRRGLTGQASFLALNAHLTSTSATLRGKFIQEVLLCHTIAPPPAGVDTSIPEPDADSPTLRERIQSHLQDPSCASCHELTDLIGLGLENFDGVGRWRDTENGALIDASGDLEGAFFDDAWGLAKAIRNHPDLGPCLTDQIWGVGTGHTPTYGELKLSEWLADDLALRGFSVRSLLLATVTSTGFRQLGAVE
jgi:hypothetical protein